MTDPTKALADAARRSVIATTRLRDDWSEAEGAAKNTLWRETHEASTALLDALAAYDAAQADHLRDVTKMVEQVPPTDEEIEAFIAKVEGVINQMCDPTSPNFARCAVDVRAGCDAVLKHVVAMMRRASPNRQAPDSALLQAAKAAVTTLGDYHRFAIDDLRREVERAEKEQAK